MVHMFLVDFDRSTEQETPRSFVAKFCSKLPDANTEFTEGMIGKLFVAK